MTYGTKIPWDSAIPRENRESMKTSAASSIWNRWFRTVRTYE